MKEFDTLAELQGSTQSKTGLRLKCRENLYEYIVQASGYTATGDDVTFANGRVAKCVFAADAKYIKTTAGNVQDALDSIVSGGLPSQSGNEFKFLTTNGASASWFQGTLQMDTFANLQTFSPTVDGTTFICQERANARYILQPSGYVALAGDVTFANGRVGALQIDGSAHVEWFDSAQAGVNRLKDNGGGTLYALGRYTITETLVIDGGSVTIKGAFSKNVFSTVVSNNDNGVFYADFTDGPAILISDGGVSLEGLIIQGSPTRRAASITSGAQNANSGILIETNDNASDIIQSVKIESVRCIGHPADGLLIEADCTNIRVVNFYSNDLGRHGLAITEGDISGRVNKALPGIIYIEKGKSFDCGGHGLVIGHPNSTGFPYRITVINREGYRLALDPAQRYSTAGNFIVGQDVEMINCAFGGTTTGNIPDHAGLEVGGRDIRIAGGRYINCANDPYVIIRQQANLSTKNIEIDGGIAFTNGTVDDFATIANGADGVHILRVTHDCTNPVTDISYNSNNNDIVLHDVEENLTIKANHTYDYSDSDVMGIFRTGLKIISSGSVTVNARGYYEIDTEGATASDTLDNISGGQAGDVVILRQENSTRAVTLQHGGGGNLRLSGATNFSFGNTQTFIQLMFDGTNWYQIAEAINNA